MRGKRWDLQLGETLHLLHFEHGRLRKKDRLLLMDGEPLEPLKWRHYDGKTPVTEYPFAYGKHRFTVLVRYIKTRPSYDLLMDGISLDTGRSVDIIGLSDPKTKKAKFLEYAMYIGLVILLRILMEFFAR
jgi:hypothetical protein